MNPIQFKRFVIEPVLATLGLGSPSAVALLLGTALHESGGLQFIDQVTGRGGAAADTVLGPAIGFFQMERPTHDDLFATFLNYPKHRPLRDLALQYRAALPADPHEQLVNPFYATAIARLKYYRASPPLPAADDVDGLARYWKESWNTAAGAGTVDEFKANWRRYGGDAAMAAA